MAEEIRKVLNLSLGESPQNVRELKTDISELKTAIGDMVIAGKTGTTEYDQAVKLLGQDLQTLLQVNNATKKEVDALDGSYNALVQKMRELKVEWRATNSEARRNELGKQISEINDQLKAFDYSIGNFGRNVGNYGNAWESLQGTVEGVEQSSNDFLSGIASLGAAMGLTASQSDSLNNSLNGVRNVVGILSGAKGILGLVKAFRSQIAASKEAKAKAAEETAALKAQKQVTDQVTTSTTLAATATKIFKKALMAIGIGLVVVAIGELAAHIQDVIKWFTRLGEKLGIINPQTQALKNSNEQLTASIEAMNKSLDREVELMEAKGATQAEIMQKQKTVIAAELAEAKAIQAKVKARIDELEVLGKRKNELKKLKEQYDKNQETIEDLEHKQAVLEAKIDTEARQAQEKAAKERAEAAKKAAEERLRAEEKANADLAAARKKAEETVNAVIDKTLTERELLEKQHQETLNNLKAASAYISAKRYKEVVEAENKIYTNELSQIISDEYAKVYEKASKQLNNKIEANRLNMVITDGLASYFNMGNYRVEATEAQNALKALNDYYAEISTEALKLLNGMNKDLSPAAKEAFNLLASFNPKETGFLTEIRNYYQEYLSDTEAFLKKYGEPFSTAIVSLGENFKSYAEQLSEGYIRSFEAEMAQVEAFVEGGAGEAALAKLDEIWLKYGDAFGGISEKAALSFKMNLVRYRNDIQGQLVDTFGVSGNEAGERIRSSYENLFSDLEAQITHWNKIKDAAEEGTEKQKIAIDTIAILEEEKRKLTLKRDSEVFTARTKMYQQYSASVSNLLGNVAQAWQNTIRAKVDADKMSEEQAEKSFEKMKAFQYAQAGISTAAAIVQALSDPDVPSFYLRAINAAAALATGVAQVAQIKATHYGSTGTASTATPKLIDRTPVVNTVSLNASEAGNSIQQNMRVYVVESDITEAQRATKARVTESTF